MALPESKTLVSNFGLSSSRYYILKAHWLYFFQKMIAVVLSSLLILGITDCDAKRSQGVTPRDRRDAVGLDPHGEFCVDVSTYTEPLFNRTTLQKCETTFTKECKDVNDEVRQSLQCCAPLFITLLE